MKQTIAIVGCIATLCAWTLGATAAAEPERVLIGAPAPLVEHVGDADPVTEGWKVVRGTDSPTKTYTDAEDTGPYWGILDVSDAGGSWLHYRYTPPEPDAFSHPDGWTATFRMKLIDRSGLQAGAAIMRVADGTSGWTLEVAGGPDQATEGLYRVPQMVNPIRKISDISPLVYRTYQMVYRPAGDVVDVYVDGYFVTTLSRSLVHRVVEPQISWGAGSSRGMSDTRWAYVSFQKGQHPIEADREKYLSSQRPAGVRLPHGAEVNIIKRIEIAVDPDRDFHGPMVTRAPNGDLLLHHQDSVHHGGGDGQVRQWRSTDHGFHWTDEGAAVKWTDQGYDSLFGRATTAPDGKTLVMIAQRRIAKDGGSGDREIVDAVWYTSTDHGKTWQLRGEVDSSIPNRCNFVWDLTADNDKIFGAAWSFDHDMALYSSSDSGQSWQRGSVVFPRSYPGFPDVGPPFYPSVIVLPNRTFLAMTYVTPPDNSCYLRRSADQGRTWGPIERRPDIPIWAPRMRWFGDEILMVHGRHATDPDGRSTIAMFSTDGGVTFGDRLVLDRPCRGGSMAYSDSIMIGDDKLWVFTSSARDIIGVLLQKCQPSGI